MNIYNLTKSQLITLWIGSLLSFFIAGSASEEGANFFGVFVIGLSMTTLVIYSIGWEDNKTKKE